MSNVSLGFDIGSDSMKIALRRGTEFRLEQVRLPDNLVDGNGITMPHAFVRFLKNVRKELRLPRAAATLVLPPNQVVCRFLTMPQMTEEQLRLNLPYEFSDFIQGEAEQYHCDYAICDSLPEDGEGVPMMAAAVAKQRAYEYVQMFTQAGIRLKTLLPQEMALLQLEPPQDAQECRCFVDLGQQSTRIIVTGRDRVQATRQIPLGCRDLDAAIADAMGVEPYLANTYKRGNYKDVQQTPACTGLYGQIAVEILKVMNFFQFTNQRSVLRGIYLTGGGASIAPLRQAIADTVETALLPPEELLGGAQDASWGLLAACAAMSGRGKA